MKKIIIYFGICVFVYTNMSLISPNDVNHFYGRWQYLNEVEDGQTHNYIPNSINIPVKYDRSVWNLGLASGCTSTAYEWYLATNNVSNVAEVQCNVQYQDGTNITQADQMNTIWMDDGADIFDFSNLELLAATFYRGVVGAMPNICPGNPLGATNRPRLILEADIIFHEVVLNKLHWQNMQAGPSSNTLGNKGYVFDFPTVLLHEYGHFLGLGHVLNNAGGFTAMVERIPPGYVHRTLSQEDIDLIRMLYNKGTDRTGIIPCNKWYYGSDLYQKCRQSPEITQVGGDEQSKAKWTCFNDEGGTHIGCTKTCSKNDKEKRFHKFSNTATLKINEYLLAESKEVNTDRAGRGFFIMIENESLIADFVLKYDEYMAADRVIVPECLIYEDAFAKLDIVYDALMPIVDATFRCPEKEHNPELLLTASHVNMMDNFLDELLLLGISNNMINEVNFLKSKLPDLEGKNVKEAYEYLLTRTDTNLEFF